VRTSRSIEIIACHAAVQAGVGYVPAERRAEGIIGDLSVRENMTLAHIEEVLKGRSPAE
jgi:ribose transport system ATP-binding protein